MAKNFFDLSFFRGPVIVLEMNHRSRSKLSAASTACLLLTLMLATDLRAQEGNQSQRPLSLPSSGADGIDQQFRIMQQLQRMVQAGRGPSESQAETKPDANSSARNQAWNDALRETQRKNRSGGTAENADRTQQPENAPGWLDSKLLKEMTKDLSPDQRDALRDLSQQFQTELKESKNPPQTPAQMQSLLQDFLRDRNLPEFSPGGSAPSLPGLPPNQSADVRSADGRSDEGLEAPEQPEELSDRSGDRPKNERQQNGNNLPTRENPFRPSDQPDPTGHTNSLDRPFEQGSSKQGFSKQPAGLNPKESEAPSTQQMLENLMRDSQNLPPLAPPPHAESGSADQADGTANGRSQSSRQAAIERQNRAIGADSSGGASGRSANPDRSSEAENTQGKGEKQTTKTIDPETVDRLRQTVQRRGLGEAFRELYRETQQQANDEAAREAQEAREKAIAEARKNALAEAQKDRQRSRNPANESGNESITESIANGNIGLPQRSRMPLPRPEGGPQDSRDTNRARGGNSGLGGMIDQEMIDSLLGDQKELERMIRELQTRTAEAANNRGGANNADSQQDRQNSDGNPSARPAQTAGQSPPSNGSNEPFDWDPLGIDKQRGNNGNPYMQNAEEKSPSITERLAEWYQAITAADSGSGNHFGSASSAAAVDSDSVTPEGSGQLSFSWSGLSALLLVIAAVAIGIWWLGRKRKNDVDFERKAIYAKLMPSSIHTRDDVIKAFHCVALASRVAPPTWWPHPKTAQILASSNPNARSAVYTLAELYEIARYSPDGGRMTSDQLTQADQALVQLKGL